MTTLETRRVVFAVLAELPPDLIEEYVRHLHRDEGEPAAVEVGVDFDKWMQLGIEMDRIDHYSESAKVGILQYVVSSMLDLLQPPSVREARAKS